MDGIQPIIVYKKNVTVKYPDRVLILENSTEPACAGGILRYRSHRLGG